MVGNFLANIVGFGTVFITEMSDYNIDDLKLIKFSGNNIKDNTIVFTDKIIHPNDIQFISFDSTSNYLANNLSFYL